MNSFLASDRLPGLKHARQAPLAVLVLSLCLALLAGGYLSIRQHDQQVLLVNDALDPLSEIIEPLAAGQITYANPFMLPHLIPGQSGLAFVFGTQARFAREQAVSTRYVPLFSATIVIAVRRDGRAAGTVTGWRTLLESDAVVLIPHHGIESGRLAAIALARALGAEAGDLTPAIEAYASLQARQRLNDQDEYRYPEYRNGYNPDRLAAFDAVVLWDYQARQMQRLSSDWLLVMPEEGSLTVDCGYLFSDGANRSEPLMALDSYLQSAVGRQALTDDGFAPLSAAVDLSAWDQARLTYNPDFRRQVHGIKRYAPASLLERLLQKAIVLFLFCLAAQRMLRRIPQGPHRETSRQVVLFIILWMMIGLVKILPDSPDLTRWCWFATYIPRHALPVFWYAMCHLSRYGRRPPARAMLLLILAAAGLSLLVLTNDLHRLVFWYQMDTIANNANDYSNGPGYFLSLAWSFTLGIAGLVLMVRKPTTRRSKRQMLYAGILMGILLAYQTAYLLGILPVLDLDIPTMIALFYLVFGLAAQQERFMGASLLTLPVLQQSPYAVAVFDPSGRVLYRNRLMLTLAPDLASCRQLLRPLESVAGQQQAESVDIALGGRLFVHHADLAANGQVVLLEDITPARRLEQSLQQTRDKLDAVSQLLERQASDAPAMSSRLEQERYALHMNQLFRVKTRHVQRALAGVAAGPADVAQKDSLRLIRFMLFICQQRLRLILRSLEEHPRLPVSLIERYAAGLIKDGRRIGLDGVLTSAVQGCVAAARIPALTEAIDDLCLYAFARAGSSLILHIESQDQGVGLKAYWSAEGGPQDEPAHILTRTAIGRIEACGGQISQVSEEDGIRVSLTWNGAEVSG